MRAVAGVVFASLPELRWTPVINDSLSSGFLLMVVRSPNRLYSISLCGVSSCPLR